MTSTTEAEFPGGYPTTPAQEKNEPEKNEGNKETISESLLQYSKDLVSSVSSVMPGKEKAEENKEPATSTQEKNEEDKNKGSSALGGITNPINLILGDARKEGAESSEQEAAKREVDPSHKHNTAGSNQKEQKSSDVVLPNAVLPESRLLSKDKHQKSDSHQTSDLTGDYNQQKEREQDESVTRKNEESDPSRQEKNEENKETLSESLLQYSKGLVSSVIPGKEKTEGNKEPATPTQGKNEEDKNKGSSALGGITNPISLLLGNAEKESAKSPEQEAAKGEVDTSHTIKPHNVAASNQKGQKSSDFAVVPKVDEHQKSDSHQTFDLTGDYNQQKGKEREQDKRDNKLSGKHHQKQESQEKSDDKITPHLPPVVIIAGDQPKPSKESQEKQSLGDKVTPHLPPVKFFSGSNDRSGKGDPTKPNSVVHPEDQSSVPKITKKDKVNATVGRAVGTLKEKIGKFVKNDNLAARGAEKKAEAKKTKELAEVQKKVDEI